MPHALILVYRDFIFYPECVFRGGAALFPHSHFLRDRSLSSNVIREAASHCLEAVCLLNCGKARRLLHFCFGAILSPVFLGASDQHDLHQVCLVSFRGLFPGDLALSSSYGLLGFPRSEQDCAGLQELLLQSGNQRE